MLVCADGLGGGVETSAPLGANDSCLPARAVLFQHPQQRHPLAAALAPGHALPAFAQPRFGLSQRARRHRPGPPTPTLTHHVPPWRDITQDASRFTSPHLLLAPRPIQRPPPNRPLVRGLHRQSDRMARPAADPQAGWDVAAGLNTSISVKK